MKKEKIGFNNLEKEVIKKGLCSYCGTCIGVCPVRCIGIVDETISLVDECKECGVCLSKCPRSNLNVNPEDLGPHYDEYLGPYSKITCAKSKRDEIIRVSQDGGVITSLLTYLCDLGDFIVAVTRDKEWKPIPVLTSDKNDIINAAGSKYSVASPNRVLSGVKDSVSVVGTPCQMEGLRNIILNPKGAKKLASKINFLIGFYCTENFVYSKLKSFLVGRKIDLKSVRKFDIKRGKFIIHEREIHEFPISALEECISSGCYFCRDFTAMMADISVGSLGVPPDHNSVIIRTEKGLNLWSACVKEGYIEEGETEVNLKPIRKLSQRKRERKI